MKASLANHRHVSWLN